MSKIKKTENAAERAVQQYERTQEALNTFLRVSEVRDFMLELQQLVDERNTALDAAHRAVKQQLLSSDQDKLVVGNIGAQKKISRWYDGDYLARELTHSQADIILEEVVTYKVKVDVLTQLLRQGEVDSEVVRLAYHEEPPVASLMSGAGKPYTLPVVSLDEEEEWQQEESVEEPPPQSEEKKSRTKISGGRKK